MLPMTVKSYLKLRGIDISCFKGRALRQHQRSTKPGHRGYVLNWLCVWEAKPSAFQIFRRTAGHSLSVCVCVCVCVCMCVNHSVVSDSGDSMDYSPPGSSVHEILQARILEWIAIFFSRESSWPRYRTWVSCIAGRCFTIWATRKAMDTLAPWTPWKSS